MAPRKVDRHALVQAARLHHVLASFSRIYYGEVAFSRWLGDDEQGGYEYDNHQGDVFTMRWLAPGPRRAAEEPSACGPLVALVFAHESERSEYDADEDERQPLRALRGLPKALEALAEQIACEMERLVTAGLWTVGDHNAVLTDEVGPHTRFAHGLEMLAGFALPPETALLGDVLPMSWHEGFSLGEAQTQLALRLAREAREAAVEMSATDSELLLDHPQGVTRAVTLGDAKAAAKLLAQCGIRWRVPRKAIEARGRWAQAQREARIAAAIAPRSAALLEAARAGDTAAVERLIAAGADINCRTVDEQFEYTLAGETPLMQALRKDHHALALSLARAANLDVDALNVAGQSALCMAARTGATEVARALVALGADSSRAESGGSTPLHFATSGGHLELVRALLDAGADPRAPNFGGLTALDWAAMHRRPRIAALLRERAGAAKRASASKRASGGDECD